MSFEDGISIPVNPPEEESPSKKILEHLFSRKNLNLKTDITDREIALLTRLFMIAKIFKVKNLAILATEFKELRVSRTRLGRTELVKVMEQLQQDVANEKLETARKVLSL